MVGGREEGGWKEREETGAIDKLGGNQGLRGQEAVVESSIIRSAVACQAFENLGQRSSGFLVLGDGLCIG